MRKCAALVYLRAVNVNPNTENTFWGYFSNGLADVAGIEFRFTTVDQRRTDPVLFTPTVTAAGQWAQATITEGPEVGELNLCDWPGDWWMEWYQDGEVIQQQLLKALERPPLQ